MLQAYVTNRCGQVEQLKLPMSNLLLLALAQLKLLMSSILCELSISCREGFLCSVRCRSGLLNPGEVGNNHSICIVCTLAQSAVGTFDISKKFLKLKI